MNSEYLARVSNANLKTMYNFKPSTSMYDNTDFLFDENYYDRHMEISEDQFEESIKSIDKLIAKRNKGVITDESK